MRSKSQLLNNAFPFRSTKLFYLLFTHVNMIYIGAVLANITYLY